MTDVPSPTDHDAESAITEVADEVVVRHPMGPRPDADIARDAANALAQTAVVPPGSVHATVHDHVVTLTGAVGREYQRHAARQAVASLKAVRAVVNHIMLETPVVISPFEARTDIAGPPALDAVLDATGVDLARWSTPGVSALGIAGPR